ncbi:MAG: hypothetical protein ABSC34_11240 [Acidimicrobiales bacterium]
MKFLIRLVAAAVMASSPLWLFAGSADAAPVNFTCVVVNVDTCTVTIALTSNMDEQVGSTMPDTQPWFLTQVGGNGAPYGVTGDGNALTTWNGVAGASSGDVWTAYVTTGANEAAGAVAVLTFAHVTSTSTTTTTTESGPQPYSSLSWSYPETATVNGFATISSIVKPQPAKGDVILQRRVGATWVRAGVLTYSPSSKRWVIKLKWTYPLRSRETFRILASATPVLSATYSGSFRISTLG